MLRRLVIWLEVRLMLSGPWPQIRKLFRVLRAIPIIQFSPLINCDVNMHVCMYDDIICSGDTDSIGVIIVL